MIATMNDIVLRSEQFSGPMPPQPSAKLGALLADRRQAAAVDQLEQRGEDQRQQRQQQHAGLRVTRQSH